VDGSGEKTLRLVAVRFDGRLKAILGKVGGGGMVAEAVHVNRSRRSPLRCIASWPEARLNRFQVWEGCLWCP